MIPPPPRTTEQQREAERDQALRIGTPAALRAWATKYAVPLIGMDDDELLLIASTRRALSCSPACGGRAKPG